MKALRDFIRLSGINQVSWLNPLLLALFPAIITIWFQPMKFDQFLFELHHTNYNTYWFEDIESDGKKEEFTLREEIEGMSNIIYHNDLGEMINQYNFNHPIARTRLKIKPYAADFNKDGIKELVLFTQNKDSLFLNIFSIPLNNTLIEDRFITKIGGFNDKKDYRLVWIGDHDVNKDSIPEFYFSVTGGFSLFPRRVFRYDVANDSLIASVNTGSGYLTGSFFTKQDSVAIAVSGVAYGNTRINYPYPYHDTTSWLFYFDTDLNLIRDPHSFGTNPGSIDRKIQFKDHIYFLYGGHNTSGEKNKLLKMNWQGEIVDSLNFDFPIGASILDIDIQGKRYYYFLRLDNYKYHYIDFENFTTPEFKKIKFTGQKQFIINEDIDKNGNTDYLVYNNLNNEIFYYNKNLKNPILVEREKYVRFATLNYFEEQGFGEIALNLDDYAKVYRYQKNPLRHLKYPVWFAIYLVSFLFVALIIFFQNKRIVQRQELEEQLADLQLQNLRNQLDPHFTFNALNSVGNAIYKQDKQGAYDLFQRFTRIIRSSLVSSDKVFRPLKEELQFTQDYLEFQKLRFKEKFDFSIEIAKEIDSRNTKFPKMLIQGFAENAVKHAFYEVNYKGEIRISANIEEQFIKININDNGIGIKESKRHKETSGTQKGIKVLLKQISQINKLYHTNFTVDISDKSENNHNEHGTIVSISFPNT